MTAFCKEQYVSAEDVTRDLHRAKLGLGQDQTGRLGRRRPGEDGIADRHPFDCATRGGYCAAARSIDANDRPADLHEAYMPAAIFGIPNADLLPQLRTRARCFQ